MLRIVLVGLSLVVELAVGWALVGGSAQAQPEFKRYFDRKYFPMEGETAMKKAYETSSCNFCHIGGADAKERKNRNAFGQALDKLLSKEDAENLKPKVSKEMPAVFKKAEDKMLKALKAVEKQHSDPKDKESPTFGDLLKEGKLPKSPATSPEK